MGAWGHLTFEDDETLDWLGDLIDADKPIAFLKECLDLEDEEELDYTAGAGAIGSAVIIDALLNGPTADLPEEAVEWLGGHEKLKVAPLVPSAIAALDGAMGEDSELNELWSENEELYPQWKAHLLAARSRLAAKS